MLDNVAPSLTLCVEIVHYNTTTRLAIVRIF